MKDVKMNFLVHLLREKSGKKLIIFSAAVFLLITAIVFFAVFQLCENMYLKLMDEYLGEIPKIVSSLNNELDMRGKVYQDDVMARAELGLILYEEKNGLTDSQKLERIRAAVSADSVSLIDGQRNLLSTTGHVSPEENFRACIKAVKPRLPHLELYPSLSGKNDGKGFVLLPIKGNTERSIVFEFSCDTMLELRNALYNWAGVLERMISGGDMAAFAKTGDKIAGYPLDGLTSEQTSRLYDELTKIFQNTNSFRIAANGRPCKLIKLQGSYYLAALMKYSGEKTDILLTVPLKNVIGNGIYIAAAISAIIGWGIVLILLYVFLRIVREKPQGDTDSFSCKSVWRATWPGIIAVLVVTVLFADMLILLDIRTNSSFIAMTKRMSVQHEIDFRKGQENTIRRVFTDFYRTRSQMLAEFLTSHTDYQTRAGLKELSDIAKADYLMLFDNAGNEQLSSNSYTGFSVGKNLSEEYRSVLMGYPCAVVGPAADPYTGKMQFGAAILITDSRGQPDGFLLAVYSAGNLNAELERMSYENAVNNFAVRKDHIAAAVNNEDGRFIAHTDKKMIGLKANDFLEDFKPGNIFEGFTEYNGKRTCISASVSDGKTLMFIVPERGESYIQAKFVAASIAVLLILGLLYYPIASILLARAVASVLARGELESSAGEGSAITVFSDGYSVFMTPFAIFALIASYNGWWTSFDYVFSWRWSKGLNLFSLWAALFIVAVTFCCKFLIRTALKHLESHISLQGKTITRLANSLTTYAANIFLIFCILDMLGVNTTTLLASAGIISIAIGMGAQSMAADLLAGVFMMLEGSVHVGDYVSVAGVTGNVTDMGIRTIEITDEEGNVVILNNSQVSSVRNMSRKNVNQKPENDHKEVFSEDVRV